MGGCRTDGLIQIATKATLFMEQDTTSERFSSNSKLLVQGDANTDGSTFSNVATRLQAKRTPEQSLQAPAQQHQGVNLWTFCEEKLFDFRRSHTLPVIGYAHL